MQEGAPAPELGTYVYGIVHLSESRLPQGLTGLDDTPVRLIGEKNVAVAVADVAYDRPPGRRRDLLAHTRVLDALSERGPVVPVRFGSLLEDDDVAVRDLLRPRLEHFDEVLRSLTGRQQFNVRAVYHEEAVLAEIVSESPAVAELRARTRGQDPTVVQPDLVRLGELVSRALESKRERDGRVVLEQVQPLAVADVVRPGKELHDVFDASFLVADAERDAFEDVLEGVAEAVHERIGLQLTGPLPPYDFVGGEEWA